MSSRKSSETSEELEFECVRPCEAHARLIMDWRNDPETRKWSFHTEPKVFETFYPDFLQTFFEIPSLPALFIRVQGERAAVVSFNNAQHPTDSRQRCAYLSINVAPQFRGKGLGTRILEEVKAWVQWQGFDAIYAEVKKENIASNKAFVKAGYQPYKEIMKTTEDTGARDLVVLYLAQLTQSKKPGKVLIIAEAGSNWRMGTRARDLQMGRTLIEQAAEAGADVVKFQTYEAQTVYVPNAGQSDYLADAGIQQDIQVIFKDLTMPEELIPEFAAHCQKCGVEFMSTPFSPIDFARVDPYVKRHKIASYEITHIRLIELAARSGKPTLMSTGAATEADIAWAVGHFQANGGKDLTLLQCTAKYPADLQEMNLRTIPWLMHCFRCPAGLSDHSADPLYAPIAAAALGATVIEKHFTLDKRLPGPDHAFAITPAELKEMVKGIRAAELMRGSGYKSVQKGEEELYHFARRGVQAIRDIKPGDIFEEDVNIAILRPGKQKPGVHPRYLPEILHKKANRPIPLGSGIQRQDWS